MEAFTVYLDASGHPDLPGAMFVSGFVSTDKKWLKFETDWLTLLDRHGISAPFHMTEFATCQGQFKAWQGDVERQTSFHAEAIALLKRRVNKSFSQGVVVEELARMRASYGVTDHWADVVHNPYTYCTLGCVVQSREWAGKPWRGRGTIKFVIEQGDKHQGHFLRALKQHFGIIAIPQTKEQAVPLQAADYIAWEHRKWLKEKSADTGRPLRRSLASMAHHLPGAERWVYMAEDKLAAWFDEKGFKKRTL